MELVQKMLNYKKIGDTISTRELNAIIYLLQKYHQITEQIHITQKTYAGEYGAYTLQGDWTVYHEAYTPEQDTDFVISVIPVFADDYQLTATIKKINGENRTYTTLLEDGAFTIPYTEFREDELLSVYAKVEVV